MKHFDEKVTSYIKNRDGNEASILYKIQPDQEGISDYIKEVKHRVPINGLGEGLEEVTRNRVVSDIYGKRILIKITNQCFAHCRYCFRKDEIDNLFFKITKDEIDEGIKYIEDNKIIDVVFSGGEPLLLPDKQLLSIIDRVFSIESMKRITFDTNIMATNPQRITSDFIKILSGLRLKYKKQIIMTIHFTSKHEFTNECKDALFLLQSHGIVLRGHTPLLKGVNDNIDMLHDLFTEMVDSGVHPYYLIHFIATSHNKHFEISLKDGLDLYRQVLQMNAGVEIPSYVFYVPTGKGKIRLLPTNVEQLDEGQYELTDRNGDKYIHTDFSYNSK